MSKARPIKVVHIITGLATGGAERALVKVLAGGLSEQFKSTVISLRDEGMQGSVIRNLGVPVYVLGMHRAVPSMRGLMSLRRVVSDVSPDIIQGWMYHGNLAASLGAHMVLDARPAVVWNVRQSLYSLAAEKLLTRQVVRTSRWFSPRVNTILYNSHLSRQQHESFGFASERGQVIPNGFDAEQLRPSAKRGQAMRKALGISQESIVIGHVARFHPMKDHVSFLSAAVEVMRQRDGVVCLLAGRGVNLQNPVLKGIVPPELENQFFLVGEREDVSDLMRAMDVFCQSSWSEAFPNVLGEAMALGLPCVVTDVGDSRYVIGTTGLIVPASDSAALAQGLLTMLDHPSDERTALGRAARSRIEARYSLPRVVEQYRQLYEGLSAA